MSKIVRTSDIYGTHYDVPIDQLDWRPSAYAIVIHEGNLLTTRQYKALHLPGGGLDKGETPEEAVVREVQEETGLIVRNPKLVATDSSFFTYTTMDTQEQLHFHALLFFYECEFVGGEFSIEGFDQYEQANGEHPEWIPLESLDSIVAGSTIDWRSIVRKYISSQER